MTLFEAVVVVGSVLNLLAGRICGMLWKEFLFCSAVPSFYAEPTRLNVSISVAL